MEEKITAYALHKYRKILHYINNLIIITFRI